MVVLLFFVSLRFKKMLTSVRLKLTTVILTPTVPTPKDRSTARVIRDTLDMESRVKVKIDQTFVPQFNCNQFILIFALYGPNSQRQIFYDFLNNFCSFWMQILLSVRRTAYRSSTAIIIITVILKQTAPIPKDPFTARVWMDILETA